MNFPEPLTLLESIAQIRFFWWSAVYDVTGWKRPGYFRARALTDAFNERKYIVGLQEAGRDYYG